MQMAVCRFRSCRKSWRSRENSQSPGNSHRHNPTGFQPGHQQRSLPPHRRGSSSDHCDYPRSPYYQRRELVFFFYMDYLISSSQKSSKIKTILLVKTLRLRKAEWCKTSWRAATQGSSPASRGGAEAHTCAIRFTHQVSLRGLVVPPLSCAQQQVPRAPVLATTP